MMVKESVDESIERFRRDREMIKERMQERNQLFTRATGNYLHSINKEIETIQKTSTSAQARNQEFSDQIKSLYLRYEAGGERLRQAFQRTNIEKINYNNYLIKVYPHQYVDQKRQLQEENERLKKQIQGLKEAHNNFDEQIKLAHPSIPFQDQIDLGEQMDHFGKVVEQPYYQQPEYFLQPEYQHPPPQPQRAISAQKHQHTKSDKSQAGGQLDDTGLLDQFLRPEKSKSRNS